MVGESEVMNYLDIKDRVRLIKIIPINHSEIPEHYKCLEVGDIGTVIEVYHNSVSVIVDGKVNVKSKKNYFRLSAEGLELKGERDRESKII